MPTSLAMPRHDTAAGPPSASWRRPMLTIWAVSSCRSRWRRVVGGAAASGAMVADGSEPALDDQTLFGV